MSPCPKWWICIYIQASPINMDATGCEQAKEICCNVNVWSILVNVILQVWHHITSTKYDIISMSTSKCKTSIWFYGKLTDICIMQWLCIFSILDDLLQDAPFFVFRVILITYYKLISSMNIFCTMKNTLVIALQFYRLIVVQIEAAASAEAEKEKERKARKGAGKGKSGGGKMLVLSTFTFSFFFLTFHFLFFTFQLLLWERKIGWW